MLPVDPEADAVHASGVDRIRRERDRTKADAEVEADAVDFVERNLAVEEGGRIVGVERQDLHRADVEVAVVSWP